MANHMGSRRRACKSTAWLAALAALLMGAPAYAHRVDPALATVDVYDRNDGTVLPVYEKDGRRYVVGTPGHEYALRVRNLTGARILAVTSVDGVNVVTGETASPDQSGYVIDAWGSVEVSGWRKSLERTAAFYFTDLGDSYAARTGRPNNVGVIGVAVFRERERRVYVAPRDRVAQAGQDAPDALPAPPAAPLPQSQPSAPPREEAREQSADASRIDRAAKVLGAPLGTGHGRSEASYATRVAFERESTTPAQWMAIQYDRRDNLIALGVIPQTRYARRAPEPFPGTRGFVPDPR
jgi:hypothetical protein